MIPVEAVRSLRWKPYEVFDESLSRANERPRRLRNRQSGFEVSYIPVGRIKLTDSGVVSSTDDAKVDESVAHGFRTDLELGGQTIFQIVDASHRSAGHLVQNEL